MSDFREHVRNHLRTAAGTYIWAVRVPRQKGRTADLRCVVDERQQCEDPHMDSVAFLTMQIQVEPIIHYVVQAVQ